MNKPFKFLIICTLLTFQSLIANETPVNALSVGLKNGLSTDQSKVLQNILDKYAEVYIPQGTYVLSKVIIPSNRKIYTDGYLTIFQQRSKQEKDVNMIQFEGSENVWMQKFSAIGTLLLERNRNTEFLNLVNIRGGSKNITLEGVKARNAWGDGLLITGNPKIRSRNPTNVTINEIYSFDNYRNGISVVGGINIKFKQVYTEKNGLVGFDAEAEGAIIDGLTVTNFNGGAFRITGRNTGSVKNITVGNMIADGKKATGSSKQYKSFTEVGDKQLHGLIICGENIFIKNGLIKNFPGAALILIRKIPSKNVVIGNLDVENCCLEYQQKGVGVPYYILNNASVPFKITSLRASIQSNPRLKTIRGKQGIVVQKYSEKREEKQSGE